ncbi:RidA family protein [Aquirhabdus parva]|uniref:RidA family protein n=1 Tax=Aquirhabdus parva TaxID=2283318 RepID=A0A345P769_9GAMM|nr:RidA family protein [Aquirhabdus parva]AXI03128.1 RidA family protein [Aquirhabdus parva]
MEITRHEMGPRFSEMTVAHVGTANLIFISGQVAENTSLDVTGQTREILRFIDRLLAHVGADKTHITAVRIYLASVGDYAAMNSVWDDWVPQGHTPARSTLGAKLIDPEYKIEIEVTAVADRIVTNHQADANCEKDDHHNHHHAH